jgi:acetylornithine deacetylase
VTAPDRSAVAGRGRLDVADLALELISVDSTSGSEAEVVALVEEKLAARGWRCRRIGVTPGRDDLLASSVDEPHVTLSTHLDTVPPFLDPRLEGGKLYGRGSCDAKGIAAAMICAAERLRDRGVPVALLFVVGEETTHDGARAANRLATSSRVLINGEPTENRLATGTKGALRLTVTVSGRAAHSAYPHLGDSAITRLVALLAELDSLVLPVDPSLGATTINIGRISGGVADNVTAPSAEARLMARIVTGEDEAYAALRDWIGDRAEIRRGESVPAVRLEPIAGYDADVVAYATDLPNLTNWGTPYLLGPGSIHVAHTDDEHVAVAELERAVDLYERLAIDALEREGTR